MGPGAFRIAVSGALGWVPAPSRSSRGTLVDCPCRTATVQTRPFLASKRHHSGPQGPHPSAARSPEVHGERDRRRQLAPSVETPEREPLTMEDLLREEESSVKSLAYGDIVEGVVVRVDPDEVLVDIGAKSEGVISNRELSGRNEAAVVLVSGERVKVYVLQPEDEEGRVILSLRQARAEEHTK